jgi:hypothetical protein
MTLTRRGKHSYGTDQADIGSEVSRYSSANGYPAEYFASASCACGSTTFGLALDDNEGAAVRKCSSCHAEHPIGDSEDFLDDAELEECACPCGAELFERQTSAMFPTARTCSTPRTPRRSFGERLRNMRQEPRELNVVSVGECVCDVVHPEWTKEETFGSELCARRHCSRVYGAAVPPRYRPCRSGWLPNKPLP